MSENDQAGSLLARSQALAAARISLSKPDARSRWLRERDRKRTAFAWAVATGLYALAFGVVLLAGVFKIDDMGDFSGPVMVRLGKPEGVDLPDPVEAPAEPVETVPPVEAAQAPVPEPTAQPVNPAPAAAPKQPVPASQPKLAPSQPTAPAAAPVAPAPAPVVIKGSETGNTYDMTFEAASGTVGRGMYVPIWVYMPLPFELPNSVYLSIPDSAIPGTADARRAEFAEIYEKNAIGIWRLKKLVQPSLESEMRPRIWAMLEDAGFDVRNAEYKEGKKLRPVTILFKVSAYSTKAGVVLEDILLESGSGYSDIDAAVLYAFKKAGFTNSGAKSINGRFTYRFD